MGIMDLLLKLKGVKKEATISVLGPSQVGKTTLVRYLETGQIQQEAPLSTLGMDFRSEPVKLGKWTLNLIDVGGQKTYQDAFWDFAVEQSNAVIYLIDSTIRPEKDINTFNNHLQQFAYVMNIIPEGMTLMILLNKQDLVDQNPITTKEFPKYYPFDNFVNKTIAFYPTSAKFGNGVEQAFNWFIDVLANK